MSKTVKNTNRRYLYKYTPKYKRLRILAHANPSGALTVGTLVDFISLHLLCPDGISGRFLKEVGDEIAAALTRLFNAFVKTYPGLEATNILLFYYDFNLDVELLVCALLTNSIHSNHLTEQPFVLFNLLFCWLIITDETHQKYQY